MLNSRSSILDPCHKSLEETIKQPKSEYVATMGMRLAEWNLPK